MKHNQETLDYDVFPELVNDISDISIFLASLWTFNVSPDSMYGEACVYNFDAFGILKLSLNFADSQIGV